MKKKMILIVEDNKDAAFILSAVLEQEGFNTRIAQNANDAYRFVDKIRPDLIILDILIPGTDGKEILLKLKSDSVTKHIPVIVCTGLDDMNHVEKLFNSGASNYIIKPFDNERMICKVKNALGSKNG